MHKYDKTMNNDALFEESYTFRLFKQAPSFCGGFASLIDLSPSEKKYNYDITADEADINALRADWYAIGDDLRDAIKDYEREREEIPTA